LVSSTNKTDCHDITEILLKVALNTIKQTNHFLSKKLIEQLLPVSSLSLLFLLDDPEHVTAVHLSECLHKFISK
jgi:hypothetical protein